jgi:hypothetical protein
MRFGRRTRVAALAVLLVALASIGITFVLAPPPTSSPAAVLNQYGVVRVYSGVTFTGTTKITITSSGNGPFFVSKLTLFLNRPTDFDIVLDSVNIDGIGAIQVSGYSAATKVVIVPAGLTFGDVMTTFPSSLNMLMMKDPMGNDAIVASGGDGNGVVIGVRFFTGGYSLGTTLQIVATVVAPNGSSVTMTTS